ncbi:unnamed protein product [Lota lota]
MFSGLDDGIMNECSRSFSGLILILVLLHLTQGNSPCFGRSLGISPCRTQFFTRESLTLYCGADQRIMTNNKAAACSQKIHECNITLAGERHNGAYWCYSNSGEQGEAVNITVTGGPVILESPVYPVPEGTSVTLRCLKSHKSGDQLGVVTPLKQSCTFSRDGRLIGVSLTGNMSFAALNRSYEGIYTCNISGDESPGSWLAVRVSTPETEPMALWKPVVVLLACVSWPRGATQDLRSFKEQLKDCLEDKDYQELLDISKTGLPRAQTPRHVVVVGAGMAGLTAAKLLQDAGHKGRVHFAGEHTGFTHAWMETAIKTAIRAAKNINDQLQDSFKSSARGELEPQHPASRPLLEKSFNSITQLPVHRYRRALTPTPQQ